ncbi:MAG: hypothetical protein M1820_009795 [Bogoriella megaspora]|nr:MAG: hypothetical protein M1820_009795 [Bogoriella megaspora]
MAEVISVPRQPDGHPYFSPAPSLRRSNPSSTSLATYSPNSYSRTSSPKPRTSTEHAEGILISPPATYIPSPPQSSPTELSNSSSFVSTPASSLSSGINTSDEDDLSFPSYNDDTSFPALEEEPPCPPNTASDRSPSETIKSISPPHSPILQQPAIDDTAVRIAPSQHVDYLSHNWQEEDILSSWRHITSNRKIFGERSRLENASWRTWAKSKYRLRTVSPETLNWLKESDVTWLYGPLQSASDRYQSHQNSEPASRISKSNSFINKKPILKKRSMSEVMLQRSLSASSLIKQAAAAIQAQQSSQENPRKYGLDQVRERPALGRASSDFITYTLTSLPPSRDTIEDFSSSQSSSGLATPENSRDRHIRFDDTVEQCIAVDVKESDFDEEERWPYKDDDDESSDDGVVMMKQSNKKHSFSNISSRSNSVSGTRPSIEKLPATKLKFKPDSPDILGRPQSSNPMFFGKKGHLSPSPSQETLRPSHPSSNFLLPPDEDEEEGVGWQPSGAFGDLRRDSLSPQHENVPPLTEEHTNENPTGLRRTPSGMFMPYEEDEDDIVANGLFGRVVDTVNTARDIAHVIWNVGWRR